MLTIDWHHEPLTLRADRTVFSIRTRTLIVADIHLGKSAAFRLAGIPIPAGTTDRNLDRLDGALAETGAERLLILGDFLHARTGRSRSLLDALGAWRRRHRALDIVLVRGNHDHHAGDPPASLGITCVDEPWADGPFAFRHHPCPLESADDPPAMAGHVHPVVRLRDIDGTWLRCPCFCFGPGRALLPAFGAFTGGAKLRLCANDRIFAVGPDTIVEVTPTGVR